jgi:hypothetical protein
MSKIRHDIIEQDGGWAYRVDGVFSETFPTHDMARWAAERTAAEQIVPEKRRASPTKTRTAIGTTKCRRAIIDSTSTSRADERCGSPTEIGASE